jgi:hypothetical protein
MIQSVRVWTGFLWLSIRTGEGSYEHGNELSFSVQAQLVKQSLATLLACK